jgi:hypothetical protein
VKRGRKPKKGVFWGAKLKCFTCSKVIQSAHVHDWVACDCPNGTGIWVDGGALYFRGGAAEGAPFEILDPGNYRIAD